jgi:predicted nucleic acid-binding protein
MGMADLKFGHYMVLPSGCSGRFVERLEHDFERVKRILVPNGSDWSRAGKALQRLARKYDYERIGQGRLTNDSLIAASAGRLGITVITVNAGYFGTLAEFLRFAWRVEKFVPSC